MSDPCTSSSSAPEQPLSRLERERARKCAKRACCESLVETNNRKRTNREICWVGHLNQAEHLQYLTAGQQWEVICRVSKSEAEHLHRLAAGRQQEVNNRASESEVQREQCLSSNQECITTYRATATVEEREQRRETHRISVSRQRSTARQSVHDLQRTAVNQFR